MSTPEGEKKMPEWSIFDRLDEVEDITLRLMEKADKTEPTLKDVTTTARDAQILSVFGPAMGFLSLVKVAHIKNPRELKDGYIQSLKRLNISSKLLGLVDSSLIKICESVEKPKAGK